MLKNFFTAFFLSALLAVIVIPTVVMAEAPAAPAAGDSLETLITHETTDAGTASKLGSATPAMIVGKIISAALLLVGIILLVLMVYAGFLWMTAGGEEKKVEDAKNILKNAIIGLVIILLAYSITTFVVNQLVGATTAVK